MNKQRVWGVALGVSVTVNVFCIAALVTLMLTRPLDRGPDRRPMPLPAEARDLFREIDPRQQPGFQRVREELGQRRRAVRDALTAQPFNSERLNLAFEQLRTVEHRAAALAHQRISEVAQDISPEQRETLAEFVERRPGPPPPGGSGGPGKRPPPPPPH